MLTLNLPFPGERFAYRDEDAIVVASVWSAIEGDDRAGVLVLLTAAEPYYRVVDIDGRSGAWVVTCATAHENIVPTIEEYEQRGGDW